MLREGDIIKVVYKKTIELPDGKNAFIVEDENSRKHLIPFLPIWENAFKLSKNILCRVDKINCNGKIFLEPLHPSYKIDYIYPFEFIKQIEVENKITDKRFLFTLIDKFGNLIEIFSLNKFSENSDKIIDCKITGIKKNTISASFVHPTFGNFVHGDYYTFKLISIETMNENKYFVFRDSNNKIHPIEYEIFNHYSLNINDEYLCRIKNFTQDGLLKIEPMHPLYKKDEIYTFSILRIEEEKNEFGEIHFLVTIIDNLGKESKIPVENPAIYSNTPFIKAKVNRINNGRLYLEEVE